MDKEEEKVAHINGRYLVVIAIIGLIGTLATLIFQHKEENQNSSIPPTSSEKKDGAPNLAASENKRTGDDKTETFETTTHEKRNSEQKNESVGVFSYTGTVVDKKSNALPGIEVVWGSQKAVTQADGTFSLPVPNEFKGHDLKIVLSKNGKNYPPIENPNGTVFILPSD